MQEEVTQKTIALSVNVGKGAARLTEQALQKAIKKFLEQKSKAPHGKQTMRQLMKQNAGVSNIEITDSNIKAFESTAKKYNIDFSLKKVKGEQTRYLVFFKGRDADFMTAAFQEFSAKKLKGRNGQQVAVNHRAPGCKPKDLIGIPWLVALALRGDGWY
ncbi:MAG: PcfB family protein, partial [Acutalibacteraceae bacterium]|nr:PcfB family protein [Acutalibacteraceae bacterium]